MGKEVDAGVGISVEADVAVVNWTLAAIVGAAPPGSGLAVCGAKGVQPPRALKKMVELTKIVRTFKGLSVQT